MRSAVDAIPWRCLPAARTGACCPWTRPSSSASSRRSWSTAARASAWSGSPTRHAAPRTHAAHTHRLQLQLTRAPSLLARRRACRRSPLPRTMQTPSSSRRPSSHSAASCPWWTRRARPLRAPSPRATPLASRSPWSPATTPSQPVRARDQRSADNGTCVLTQSARRGHRAQGWHHHAAHTRGRGARCGRAAGRNFHHGRARRRHCAKRARGTCPLHA